MPSLPKLIPLAILLAGILASPPSAAAATGAGKKSKPSPAAPASKESIADLYARMRVQVAEKRFGEALETGRKALALPPDPDWTPKVMNTVATAHMGLEQWEDAVKVLDDLLGKYGPNRLARYNLGSSYMRLRRYEEAERCFLDFLSSGEGVADAYYYLGEIYMIRKDYQAAYGMYGAAVEKTPRNPLAWIGKGDASYALHRWEDAAAAYGKIRAEYPFKVPQEYLFRYGYALMRLGRYDESEEAYLLYLKHKGMDSNAYYNLACLYSLRKDAASSLGNLRKAFELGFDDPVVKIDKDLEFVRGRKEFRDLLATFGVD